MKDSEILLEKNRFLRTNETVTLYHGSKSGIRGKIAPISRERCDFGKGFYMGTDRIQPLTCRKYRRENRFFDEILKAGE